MLESKVMNKRSYYTDSYTTEFSALVIEAQQEENINFIILDHTYFYPTSGGQPFDTGTINGIPVTEVMVRKEDGAILHTLERVPQTKDVTAVVNWERRFDHMQQHTGQHILSQAFIQLHGAQTIGFHLSDDTATIDLDKDKIDESLIDAVEDLANQIIWQNRPVVVRWATRLEAQALPLRKIPESNDEKLRLIDIADFDLTACGGTHVARTGEIGFIKVIKQESRNKKARIHFCCGQRALIHYRFLNQIVHRLTTELTTGAVDLATSIIRLQDSEKESRRTLKRLRNQLNNIEAQQLLRDGRTIGDNTLIVQVFVDEPISKMRGLASRLVEEDGVIALLGSIGDRAHLVFGRSVDAPGIMNELLQSTLQRLGTGSGGGNEKFAQGSGSVTDVQAVQQAIENAERQLLEEIDAIG